MQSSRERAGRRGKAIRFGRVVFDVRERLRLTVTEYLLLDVVRTLSIRTGWCFASRRYLAELFGISARSVQRLVSDLESKGLLQRKPGSGQLLRTTDRFTHVKLSD